MVAGSDINAILSPKKGKSTRNLDFGGLSKKTGFSRFNVLLRA
jgi:hypothetical protein